MSPPGSREAADIGYINIPNIVKEPPSELVEVQEFTDNTGFLYSTKESNAWVLKSLIEEKKAAFDLIVPLFPKVLRYTVPWIVCEYGLHCAETFNSQGLKFFTLYTIRRRAIDYLIVAEALGEKRWRDTEKPLRYLRVVIKRMAEKEKIQKEHEKQYLFGDPKYLSFDAPLITSDPEEALIKNDIDEFFTHKTSPEDYIVELNYLESLNQVCKSAELSEKATNVLLHSMKNVTNKADVSAYLGFSKSEYDSIRKEIDRKKQVLQRKIMELFYTTIS